MPLPLIPMMIGGKLLSANQNLVQQQQQNREMSEQGNIDNIIDARFGREQARNEYQPPGRIGVRGMALPGEAMQKQEQIFNSILSKYGAGNWQGVKGGY